MSDATKPTRWIGDALLNQIDELKELNAELLAMLERMLPYLRESAILLPEIGSVCQLVNDAEQLLKKAR